MNNTKVTKRIASTKDYIDALSENHSKLTIVRVDLSYKKPYSDNKTLNEANADIEHMFNNMRSKPSIFKDKVGYIIKKEYTKDKGVHIHAVIIYDGQKIHKDAFKGDQIGKYWNKLTKNTGTYYNCNRNKYKEHGIGMLEHTDDEKRKKLDEHVISYLCKDDHQDIEPIKENKNSRAFSRGVIPKSKNNIGRPRINRLLKNEDVKLSEESVST